jgi:hypothetical protein
MADFEVCNAKGLPDDLSTLIKTGQVADAKKLFDDCMPLRALGKTNAAQAGNETKNQVMSMRMAAQTVGEVSDEVIAAVRARLGLKPEQKTGLED